MLRDEWHRFSFGIKAMAASWKRRQTTGRDAIRVKWESSREAEILLTGDVFNTHPKFAELNPLCRNGLSTGPDGTRQGVAGLAAVPAKIPLPGALRSRHPRV
jgi:hypothetical protein